MRGSSVGTRFTRRTLAAALFAVLVVAAVMVPALAFAADGDYDAPVALPALPWTASVDGTFTATSLDGETDYEYWYSLPMTAGQTVSVEATVPAIGEPGFVVFPSSFSTQGFLFSDYVDWTHQKLAIMAPHTGNYVIGMLSSAPGTFTINATVIAAPKYPMSGFSVPKKAKKKTNFTVAVNVSPDYDSFSSPIRFYVERKSGKKYKKYSNVGSSIYGGSSSFTKFTAKLKLPKGTYRVRARFTDAVHPVKYTAWKSVTVK